MDAATPSLSLALQPGDALLLQIVLKVRPFDAVPDARVVVWNEIARAFVLACAARGVANTVTSRAAVTRRVSELTLLLLEQPSELPRELRVMVCTFHERNCLNGYGPRLADAFLTTLRTHANTNAADGATTPAPVRMLSTDSNTDVVYRKRAVEDEWMLRLVMTHRPFDAGNAEAWTTVTDTYNTRLRKSADVRSVVTTVVAAQERLRSATTALLDATSPYHAYLLPRVRAMLIEVNMLTAPARVETVERRESTPTAQVATVHISTPTDELLLRLVLVKRPFDTRGEAQAAVWSEIAEAYVAASGDDALKDGIRAMRRVACLTNTMLHNPQVLKPELRAMLRENLEHYRRQSSMDTLSNEMVETLQPTVPRKPVQESSPQPGTASVDLEDMEVFMRIVLKKRPFDATHGGRATIWKEIASDFKAVSRVGVSATNRISFLTERALASPRTLPPVLRRMIFEYHELNCKSKARYKISVDSLAKLRKHAALEEEEKEVAAEDRDDPCDHARAVQTGTSAELPVDLTEDPGAESEDLLELGCDEVIAHEGRSEDGGMAACISDEEHAFLSSDEVEAKDEDMRVAVTAMGSRLDEVADDNMRDRSAPQPHTDHRTDLTHDENAQLTIERRPSQQDTRSNEQTTTVLAPVAVDTDKNELLMQIVLEKRPFDAKKGTKMKVWNDVAAAFAAAGGPRIHRGSGAIHRIGVLGTELRDRPHMLTPTLRAMILEYQKLSRQAKGGSGTDDTTSDGLRESSTETAVHTVTETTETATQSLLAGSPDASVPDHSTDTTAVGPDVSDEEDEHITVVIRPRRRDEDRNEPPMVSEAGRDAKRRRVDEPLADSQGVETVDRVGPTTRTPPASRPASATTNDGNKHPQDETTKPLETLERDRRAHSEQHVALIEKLEGERQAHENETSVMLAAIDRDRQERRDEFVAMVTLMAQSLHPAPA